MCACNPGVQGEALGESLAQGSPQLHSKGQPQLHSTTLPQEIKGWRCSTVVEHLAKMPKTLAQ